MLRRAELSSARFALDGEGRREASAAARALRAHLPTALRARGRKLVGELLEVALCSPAAETDRDPVAERFPPLLLQPVSSLAHTTDGTPRENP
jgi:hypothetical protein